MDESQTDAIENKKKNIKLFSLPLEKIQRDEGL